MKKLTAIVVVSILAFAACGKEPYEGTAACEDGWKRFKARVEADVRAATTAELKAVDKGHDNWVKNCDAYGEEAVVDALK